MDYNLNQNLNIRLLEENNLLKNNKKDDLEYYIYNIKCIKFLNISNFNIAIVYIKLCFVIILSFISSVIIWLNKNLQVIMLDNLSLFYISLTVFLLMIFGCSLFENCINNMNSKFYNNNNNNSTRQSNSKYLINLNNLLIKIIYYLFCISQIICINYLNLLTKSKSLIMAILLLVITIGVLLTKLATKNFDVATYIRDIIYTNLVVSVFYCIITPILHSVLCAVIIIVLSSLLIVQTRINIKYYTNITKNEYIKVINIYLDAFKGLYFCLKYFVNRNIDR